jgi:hypothetical protein
LKLWRYERMPSRGTVVGGVLGLVLVAILGLRLVPGLFGGSEPEAGADASSSSPTSTTPSLTEAEREALYRDHLARLRSSPFRNTNHDDSPYRSVPSAELVPEEHYGPREAYLNDPGGNAEQSFPIPEGGQFRAGCEFSHFAYDDPLVAPNRPGVSHLHMFFGNTDVNAYSTYDTLINSGSSTCNGQELNRTGYWLPAMFDSEGNVRIPERAVVYYKGEGKSRGASVPYAEEAALVALQNINTLDNRTGGAEGKFSFVCSDQWSGPQEPASNTMPDCNGSRYLEELGVEDEPHVVLEMNVKFPQCWNGQDPSDWGGSYSVPAVGSWYNSDCAGEYDTNLPNLEYFVNYRVDIGETTRDWFLASDVDPSTYTWEKPGGATVHVDWWGGWNTKVSRLWIDNCVNFSASPAASDCGFGYLSDGGPDSAQPLEGPALRYRPQYEGPYKIPAGELFEVLCASLTDREFTKPEDAAYCTPQG